LNREGALEDLFQTLDRMNIKPMEGKPFEPRYTEHRVVKAKSDVGATIGKGIGSGQDSSVQSTVADRGKPDDDTVLLAGDRVIIRYLDDPRSRSEFYILTDRASDPLNGLLSLSSPLTSALSDASPGDEITIHIGDRDRTLLFVALDREPRRPA
jgi:transcription elongation GreA/GreB family factor